MPIGFVRARYTRSASTLMAASALPALLVVTSAARVTMPSAPKAPRPSLTPSVAAADALEQSFRLAVNKPTQTGKFSVTVNQQQLRWGLSLRAPASPRQQ